MHITHVSAQAGQQEDTDSLFVFTELVDDAMLIFKHMYSESPA
jgi:hypothetical protein